MTKEILKAPWAYVWDNGVWHTFDAHGAGGENSSCEKTVDAVIEATEAAIGQDFVTITPKTLEYVARLMTVVLKKMKKNNGH